MSLGDDLDLAGGQVGVRVALGPPAHLAGHLDAVLVAQVVRLALGEDLVAEHHLDDAGRVPQVDEGHAAVIAPAGHPPGQGDGLSGVLGTQGAGLVGAEHGDVLFGVGVRSAPPSYGTPPAAPNRSCPDVPPCLAPPRVGEHLLEAPRAASGNRTAARQIRRTSSCVAMGTAPPAGATVASAPARLPGNRQDDVRRVGRGGAQPAVESRCSSSAVSSSPAAAAESRAVSGRDEPGIGMTTGEVASIQARVTCCGLTPWASATSWNGAKEEPSSPALLIPPSGRPRQEGDAHLVAQPQLGLAAAVGRRVLVLHADQPAAEHLLGQADLLRVGVGDAGHLRSCPRRAARRGCRPTPRRARRSRPGGAAGRARSPPRRGASATPRTPHAGASASCRWSTSRRRGAGGRPWWPRGPGRRRRPRSAAPRR